MKELQRSLAMRSSEDNKKETREQVQARWEGALQKLLTVQGLADNLVNDGGFSTEKLSFFSVKPVVLQTLEQLGSREREVHRLLSQVHQQLEDCRRLQEKLAKVWRLCGSGLVVDPLDPYNPLNLQDLQTVNELVSSCTMVDLGSELQTSRLTQRFKQARPHFMVRWSPSN